MKKIKVLYAEDERIVGKAIVNNLREYDTFEVGDLLTGNILNEYEEITDVLVERKPDVLLLDMDLNYVPDGGLKILKAAKRRKELEDMKVIIVSTRYKVSEEKLIKETLKTGVSGFIGKNADWEKLVNAISLAYKGQRNIFSKNIIDILAASFDESIAEKRKAFETKKGPPSQYEDGLTRKEKEVFALVCQGLEKKVKLEQLKIAPGTYDNHWSSIKDKLDVRNEVQCVLYALKHRIDVGLQNWD